MGISACFVRVVVVLIVLLVSDIEQTSGMVGRRLLGAGAGSGGSGGKELIFDRATFRSAMPPTRGRFGGSANTTSVGIGVSAGGSFGGSDNATSIGVGVSVGEGFGVNAGVSFPAATTGN